MTDKLAPDIYPPGDRLKEELDARGWTQADLADILGRPARLISEIINAKRSITPETAKGLGEALGTGPELWMNLETQYRLAQTDVPNQAIARRARIFGSYPVKEMQKRGWLSETTNLANLERNLMSFFQIASLDEVIKVAHAAKKTSYDRSTILQAAWLIRAQQLAPKLQIKTFATDNLKPLYKDLRACAHYAQDAAKVPALLAEAGIRLIVVEPLPGSKIDAASMWFDAQPLIALTLRYDKHDIFWHALFHELDHIDHGEGKEEPVVDSDLMSDCSHGLVAEKRANQSAASHLISPPKLDGFISEAKPFYSEATILAFANSIRVHPGIVVGQLQHRRLIPWSAYSKLKSKIRAIITTTALTDGFGHHPAR
jgi:HTH-type transcriptional regulator/antitoxin HigA